MTQISRRGVLTPLGIELAEAYETRSLSEVAKEYGVAKRSITEAFKTHYGMTKDEWWQQHKGRIYRPGRPFTYWDRDTHELTAEGAELSAYMETHSFRETQEVYGVSPSTLQRLFELAHNGQTKRAWLKTQKAPRT